ncbi:MAG: YafY family protein [Bacteroidota bacterium]
MKRFDRITHILIRLQAKRLVTAREIAERFGVSLRTVYRDIRTLREAGVPVGEEEGRGYFMVDGYQLPPVMFTREEAAALTAVEKALGYSTDRSLKAHFQSALLKIKAVLGHSTTDELEYLHSRIGIAHLGLPESDHLSTIQRAIIESQVLRLVYRSGRKDEVTERNFHPYGLYFNALNWYVIGHCQLRDNLREFRLDRIQALSATGNQFAAATDFRIDQYLKEREAKLFSTPDKGLSPRDA